MPSDIDAAVIANTRLSDDYCVIALDAPEIAATAQPGQFVMIKTARGMDPLLRRPFSIFEILRGHDGAPIGITLLNKRIGVGHRPSLRNRTRRASRVPRTTRPAVRADRSAGAGVDGGRRRRPRAVFHAGRSPAGARNPDDALLRRASGGRAVLRRSLRGASASTWSSATEDGSRRRDAAGSRCRSATRSRTSIPMTSRGCTSAGRRR